MVLQARGVRVIYLDCGPASALLALVYGVNEVSFLEEPLLVTSVVPGRGSGILNPPSMLRVSLSLPHLSSNFSLSHLQVVRRIRTYGVGSCCHQKKKKKNFNELRHKEGMSKQGST